MKIDTNGLEQWPEPGAFSSGASGLRAHGANFHTSVETANSVWQGLTSYYQSPHQTLLYDALEPAIRSAQQALTGCDNAAAALDSFAEELSSLLPERDSLKSEIAAYEAKSVPEDPEEHGRYLQEGRLLQLKVNLLVAQYEQAVSGCSSALGSIRSDGTATRWSKYFTGNATKFGISFLRSAAESHKVDVFRTTTRFSGSVYVHGLEYSQRLTMRSWDFDAWKFKWEGWRDGAAWKRFKGTLYKFHFGPYIAKYGDEATKTITHWDPHYFFHETNTSKIKEGGTSGGARIVGRGFQLLSVGLTLHSEYTKADERFKDERPELTDKERNAKAIETAAVRTGSQVAASALAGAAIGSAIPVGGTVVGLAVGAAVGLAMSYEWDNGKSAGDYVADGGEAAWTWGKSFFTEDTPAG